MCCLYQSLVTRTQHCMHLCCIWLKKNIWRCTVLYAVPHAHSTASSACVYLVVTSLSQAYGVSVTESMSTCWHTTMCDYLTICISWCCTLFKKQRSPLQELLQPVSLQTLNASSSHGGTACHSQPAWHAENLTCSLLVLPAALDWAALAPGGLLMLQPKHHKVICATWTTQQLCDTSTSWCEQDSSWKDAHSASKSCEEQESVCVKMAWFGFTLLWSRNICYQSYNFTSSATWFR